MPTARKSQHPFFALVLCTAPALAVEEPMPLAECELFADLAPRWRAAARDLGVPGYSLAIVVDGTLFAEDAFGVRNPDGDPVDGDTLFYVASCTKTFTAGALAVLAEQGKLDLDDPARAYLPRFQLADATAAEQITVRDLLGHRPGINSFPIVFLDAYSGEITEDRYYHWLSQAEPSGEVTYTNVHFTLAGRVLEAVSGKPWKDALRDVLFEPAGMRRTTAYASRMYADPNVALPMERDPEGRFVACAVRKGDNTMHAAGGSGTSAREAARWLEVQLADGQLDGVELDASAIRGMRERNTDKEPDGTVRRLDGFGLGWMLGTYRGRPYVTHGGGYVGTAAHFSFLPEEGLGVVVLANGSPSGQAFVTIASIDVYDRLLGEEGHEDLLPAYIRRIAEEPAAVRGRRGLAAKDLELHPERYVGRYHNDHWGVLSLTLEEGELRGAFGDLVVDLEPTDGGRFLLSSSAGQELEGRFVVESDRVQAVQLDGEGYSIELSATD